uniref:SET domain-containing protein n=1 Tax=Chaetoceros debilis TaxID=122233 RepID=A0A7S3Q5D1_9STRA
MELFVEYGNEWFSGREYKFGPLPLSHHFDNADDIVERFWRTAKEEDQFAEDLYNFTLDLVTDVKLKMAMPKDFEDAKKAKQDGTAILTVPEAVKTDEWLKENGTCLDNIRADQSTVDQAGRGAFATRKLKQGTAIAPLPMIHMDRHKLQIFEEGNPKASHQQMILNYSYGHKDSSLLLFPYSPVVNYINNNIDKEKVNAEVRWSTGFGKNWENKTTAEIFETENYAGLVLEIIAIKDIQEDEEIFIDYGQAWDDAWQKHLNDWKRTPDSEYFIPVHRLNQSDNQDARTEAEQRNNPYPPNVEIICYIQNEIFEQEAQTRGEVPYERYMAEAENQNSSQKCKIVRRSDDSNGQSKYLVAITKIEGGKTIQVNNVPRQNIELVNRPYSSDQHLENSFRHEIQIPDSIFPEKWRDLKG